LVVEHSFVLIFILQIIFFAHRFYSAVNRSELHPRPFPIFYAIQRGAHKQGRAWLESQIF
jgi:hypothetical protein